MRDKTFSFFLTCSLFSGWGYVTLDPAPFRLRMYLRHVIEVKKSIVTQSKVKCEYVEDGILQFYQIKRSRSDHWLMLSACVYVQPSTNTDGDSCWHVLTSSWWKATWTTPESAEPPPIPVPGSAPFAFFSKTPEESDGPGSAASPRSSALERFIYVHRWTQRQNREERNRAPALMVQLSFTTRELTLTRACRYVYPIPISQTRACIWRHFLFAIFFFKLTLFFEIVERFKCDF